MKSIIAVFKDPDKFAAAKSKLEKSGIKIQIRTEGIVETLENGYPNAIEISEIIVDEANQEAAANVLGITVVPHGTGRLCPVCNSSRGTWSQGFLRWLVPLVFIQAFYGIRERSQKCLDCGYEWQRYNRPSW